MFTSKKSKACKMCLLITLNNYIKGERNKIVFIYFKIITHFTHEDKFCQRVGKTKLCYISKCNIKFESVELSDSDDMSEMLK